MSPIIVAAILASTAPVDRISPEVFEIHNAPWNVAIQSVIRPTVKSHRAAGIRDAEIFRMFSVRINFEAEELDIRLSTEEPPHDYRPLSPLFVKEWFP